MKTYDSVQLIFISGNGLENETFSKRERNLRGLIFAQLMHFEGI